MSEEETNDEAVQEEQVDETPADETDDQQDDAQDTAGETAEQEPEAQSDEQPAESESEEEANAATEAVPAAMRPVEPAYADEDLNEMVRRAIEPVSGDNPCGDNEDAASSVVSQIQTRGDGIHESLRDAFGSAIRDEDSNGFDLVSEGRDAEELAEQVVECLSSQCKSLVLASYLPQLLLICRGLPGFDAGLMVFREICLRYPDQRYPRDTDRLASFLRQGVYVGNDDKVTDNFKLFLYLAVTEPSKLPYALLRNARLRNADPSVEGRYSNDAAKSTPAFYVKLIGDLGGAIESAKTANEAIGEHLGDTLCEIVSFSFLESLERMLAIIENLATENCAGYPPPTEEEEAAAAAAAAGGDATAMAAVGEIATREQAIKMLGKIADFFHRTERHSPISYRVRETIRWCNMDLPELLQVLLDGDQSSLDEMQKRVGFNQNSTSNVDSEE